jgi:hypothetical protein
MISERTAAYLIALQLKTRDLTRREDRQIQTARALSARKAARKTVSHEIFQMLFIFVRQTMRWEGVATKLPDPRWLCDVLAPALFPPTNPTSTSSAAASASSSLLLLTILVFTHASGHRCSLTMRWKHRLWDTKHPHQRLSSSLYLPSFPNTTIIGIHIRTDPPSSPCQAGDSDQRHMHQGCIFINLAYSQMMGMSLSTLDQA